MQFHGKTDFRIQLYYVLNVVQRFWTVFHSILRNKTSNIGHTIDINIGQGAQVCYGLFLQDVT